MGIISRYILRQIWIPALIASIVISFVLIAGTIQTQLKELLREVPIAQITLMDISWISIYSVPTLVGFLFPVTFLMAIMLAYGRMAQYNEIVALKAAGVPLKRLILPVILLGVLLSGICFLAQDVGQPWAQKRLTHLLRSDLPLRVTIDMLPTGAMHQYGEWRVYVGRKEGGALRDIVVLQPLPDGRANAFYAESAQLVKENGVSMLEMRHGHYIQAEKGDMVPRTTFEVGRRAVPSLSPRAMEGERKSMSLAELFAVERETVEKLERTQAKPVERDLRAVRLELSQRLSFPLMCLAVSMLAAPIGARIKRAGRSYTFASGLAIVAVYFTLSKVMEPRTALPLLVFILMQQTPNILLGLAGTALIWRVDRV